MDEEFQVPGVAQREEEVSLICVMRGLKLGYWEKADNKALVYLHLRNERYLEAKHLRQFAKLLPALG